MKKMIIPLLLCLCLLSGCAVKQTDRITLETLVDQVIEDLSKEKTTDYRTNKKSYYSYYLPAYIGRRDSTQASDTFVMHSEEIIMAIDASGVVADKYYSDSSSYDSIHINDKALFSKVYSLQGSSSNIRFSVNVFEVDESYYLLVKSRFLNFFGYVDASNIPDVVTDILRVMRNTDVNNDNIIEMYSNKENITYKPETYSVFSQSVAENGRLAEMLKDYFRTYDIETEPEGDDEVGEFGSETDTDED